MKWASEKAVEQRLEKMSDYCDVDGSSLKVRYESWQLAPSLIVLCMCGKEIEWLIEFGESSPLAYRLPWGPLAPVTKSETK